MILERIIIVAAVLISYFIQTSVDFFKLGDIKPDFLLLLVIYYSVHKGSFAGVWVGFLAGILQDVNMGVIQDIDTLEQSYYIGMNIIPKTLVGYFVGKVASSMRKESFLSWAVMVFVFSLIKSFLVFILTLLFYGNVEAETIVTVIFPESVYNGALSVVWVRLLYWLIPPIVEK